MKESTSDPAFLKRTGFASLVTGVVAGLVIALRWDWAAASGFMVAMLWSVANFAILAAIIKAATHPGGMQTGRFATLAGQRQLQLGGRLVAGIAGSVAIAVRLIEVRLERTVVDGVLQRIAVRV